MDNHAEEGSARMDRPGEVAGAQLAAVPTSVARRHVAGVLARRELARLQGKRASKDFVEFKSAFLRATYADSAIRAGFRCGVNWFPFVGPTPAPIAIYRAAQPSATVAGHLNRAASATSCLGGASAFTPGAYLGPETAFHESLRHQYLSLHRMALNTLDWTRRGFALSGLRLDNQLRVESFEAHSCTVGDSALTSDILSYELLLQHESAGHIYKGSKNAHSTGLRPALRLDPDPRNGQTVLCPPADRPFSPLIRVQAMVAFRNPRAEGKWSLLGTRALGPAPRWDIGISRDFLVADSTVSVDDRIDMHFDMQGCLVKQLLEIGFGERPTSASGVGYRSEVHESITAAIKDPNGGAAINFLGVVTDLETLRSTFTFLILVDDMKLLRQRYIVESPGNEPYLAGWFAGYGAHRDAQALSCEQVEKMVANGLVTSPEALGMLSLFDRVLTEEGGILDERYPDFPLLILPA